MGENITDTASDYIYGLSLLMIGLPRHQGGNISH